MSRSLTRMAARYARDRLLSDVMLEDEPARLAEERLIRQRLPTKKEIRRKCEQIRAGWVGAERRERMVVHNPRAMTPVVAVDPEVVEEVQGE